MDQVGGQRRQSVILPFRPAILDRRVLTLKCAGFLQALAERCEERLKAVGGRAVEKPDHGHRLLRPRRQRPRRNAPEQRDELSPPHFMNLSLQSRFTASSACHRSGGESYKRT